MRKLIYILSIFLVLFFSCKNKDGYVVTSKIQNLTDSLVYITHENTNFIDTIVCKNGQFVIEGNADSLAYLSVYVQSLGIWLDIWAENKDKIVISGDTKYPELIEIRGNIINNKLSDFKSTNRELIREKTDLFYQQKNASADSLNGNSNEASYSAKISNINFQLKEKAENFIKKNPKEPASVILLRNYLIDWEDMDKMHGYLSLIQAPATKTAVYKHLELVYQKNKLTTIGSSAPVFEIIDIKNDTASLEDFKGKYLLLTFAASWCDVCRKDNKELVKAYDKYNSKGLQMFTVSFDENKKDWQTAAKEDKINWRQAIDTHGWGAEMLELYNITTIPSNFLIDKNGIIIGKNLFGEELMHILKEKLE